MMFNLKNTIGRLAVALCVLLGLAQFAPLAVQPALAQDPDCYTVIYDRQETSIPFLPGVIIVRSVKVGTKFDPAS